MTMMCLSLSHRFVPAEALEKLAVPAAELGAVLAGLRALPGVDEAVVLSTCNRVEVYAAVSGPAGPVAGAVAGLLAAEPAPDVAKGPSVAATSSVFNCAVPCKPVSNRRFAAICCVRCRVARRNVLRSTSAV